jgi:glycerol uptake facilitator-like aquaporin
MKDNTEQEQLISNHVAKPEIAEPKKEESAISCDLWKQSLFEFVGTFMFMSIIYYCKGEIGKFIFGFWVILTIFSGFSGAHVNPAVTLGFYVFEGNWMVGLPKLLMYWTAQFLGALTGAEVTKRFFSDVVYVGVPTNQPLVDIMYGEFFFTGTFLFVILWACSKETSPTPYAPINCGIIVGWFYLIVNAGASLSGAAYNPAILTVLNCIAYQSKDPKAIHYLGYMIGSECAGAIIFAFIFSCFFEPYIRNKNKH